MDRHPQGDDTCVLCLMCALTRSLAQLSSRVQLFSPRVEICFFGTFAADCPKMTCTLPRHVRYFKLAFVFSTAEGVRLCQQSPRLPCDPGIHLHHSVSSPVLKLVMRQDWAYRSTIDLTKLQFQQILSKKQRRSTTAGTTGCTRWLSAGWQLQTLM